MGQQIASCGQNGTWLKAYFSRSIHSFLKVSLLLPKSPTKQNRRIVSVRLGRLNRVCLTYCRRKDPRTL